jgi:hypothetical protein
LSWLELAARMGNEEAKKLLEKAQTATPLASDSPSNGALPQFCLVP